MKFQHLKSVTLALLLTAGVAHGAPTAQQIVQRSIDQGAFNLTGAEMSIEMLLRKKNGETRRRVLNAKTKRFGKLNRTLTRFTAPPDVAGTSFLFVENDGKSDDQYMFLPALKIVRRIVGGQKNSSFMGSDFTYGDLESRDLENSGYKMLPEKNIGKHACYVIEATPRKPGAYKFQRAYIRKTDQVLLKLEFFDIQGRPLKTLFVKELKPFNKVTVATKIKVKNLQTGHSTLMTISGLKERADLQADTFTVRELKKR